MSGRLGTFGGCTCALDYSVDARALAVGRNGGRVPIGHRREEKQSPFRASNQSLGCVSVGNGHCLGTCSGNTGRWEPASAACELEVVTGLTFHDKSVNCGQAVQVSAQGCLGEASGSWLRLSCSVPWAGSSAAVPELSGGFSVGHGAQSGGQKESCPHHAEERTGRRRGPGGGSGRPSLVAFLPSTARRAFLALCYSSFPIPA